MPKRGNGFRRILKREISRLIAWLALFVVLALYPLLLIVVYSIAFIHYRCRR